MKRVIVLSGAGLSAESGIPTFRDSNGLWEGHKVEEVCTPGAWKRDRQKVLDFYAARYESIAVAVPNAAHIALASLESKFKVLHITQNIDDLLERAGCSDVMHLHGSINSRKCSGKDCSFRCEHSAPVIVGDLCSECGAQMRPDIVWFEEPVHMDYERFNAVRKEASPDGYVICVGTSGTVQPAASLLNYFGRGIRNKYLIDAKQRHQWGYRSIVGLATQQIPRLVESLLIAD